MNKDGFWKIIDNGRLSDTDLFFSNLEEEMQNLEASEVIQFRAYIGAYLSLVNETVWLDMACKVINGYVSDDTALYFTLWVISRGEDVLLNSLIDPDSLANLNKITWEDAEFEIFMSIGLDIEEMDDDEAYFEELEKTRIKCIEEIKPDIKFKEGKTFGNYENFDDAMKDIPNILPKLIERAAQENFNWNRR